MTYLVTEILTIAFALAGSSLAFATSVSTDADSTVDSKSTKRIERSDRQDVRATDSRRQASGRESRRSTERSSRESKSLGISTELGASSLLLPTLIQIERGEVVTDSPAWNQLFTSCRLFSDQPPVPLVMPTVGKADYLNGALAKQDTQIARSMTVAPSNTALFGVRNFGRYAGDPHSLRLARPDEAARCYVGYGLLLSHTVQLVTDRAGSRSRDQGVTTAVLNQDPTHALLSALQTAVRDDSLWARIDQIISGVMTSCRLQADYYALTEGLAPWSCGSLRIDPAAVTATLGGLTVLGDNTFWGGRVNLARNITSEKSTGNTASSSDYATRETGKETAADLVSNQTLSRSRETGASSRVGGKADVSATPSIGR